MYIYLIKYVLIFYFKWKLESIVLVSFWLVAHGRINFESTVSQQ